MTDKNKTNIDLAKKIFREHDTNISHITNIAETLEKEGENGWAVKLKAHSILVGEKKSPKDVLDLNKELKNYRAFGFSRKILSKLSEKLDDKIDLDIKIKIIQQHALCTYKDPDITINKRFDDAEIILIQAFEILDKEEKKKNKELTAWHFQETCGIAGAINKYRWESDGRKENLERSLNFYKKGYKLGPKTDYGYTGINYAYVLDYLAYLEFNELTDKNNLTDSIKTKLEEAINVRYDLIKVLPTIPKLRDKDESWLNDEWWYFATIAEAYFGVQKYTEALTCLKDANKVKTIAPWEKETTVRQLANIARFNHKINQTKTKLEETEAWKTLKDFVGKADIAGVSTAFLGKVGLALSGGGFRASLFHIGVLAKLAELDMLRHIEVLSCVSGGSIIGTHYYLEIRNLLQKNSEIKHSDYIDLVKRIEKDFLEGVQKNIRTKIASEFITNLKMIHSKNYSRTMRGGELYEEDLFSKVDDGEGDCPRWLNDLFINPKDQINSDTGFNPKYDNWVRSHKVPILILNATTLNTGHNWQFTASWMGEPPTYINRDIDDIDRLRRMYYWQAPKGYNKYRLGYAVAASSAVPAIFEPIPLEELYPDKKVLLVDGGVYDNQGVASLLEQDCSVMLVSDASGVK